VAQFSSGHYDVNMAVTTRLSVAEFEQMPEPDQPGKQELLDGELIQLPPAKRPHNKITKAFYETFKNRPSRPPGNASRLPNVSRHLAGADVSVTWPEQLETNDYFQGSPMIAIEVVSPGNTADEIDLKVTAYLNHGALEVWIVYPRTRHTYTSDSAPVMVKLSEILS
jgi:Uma2 family endonuclease